MATLPGELVLLSPWRDQVRVPLPASPSSKKARPSMLPSVSVRTVKRCPGSCSAHVEWGSDVVLYVTQLAPRPQPQSNSQERGLIEVEVFVAPFAGSQRYVDHNEQEISRLVSEALSVSVDLTVYPRSLITFRVQVLQLGERERQMSCLIAAAICGATAALENSDIARKGRVLAVPIPGGGIGFEIGTSRIAMIDCCESPDIDWALSAVRELEKELEERGVIPRRILF